MHRHWRPRQRDVSLPEGAAEIPAGVSVTLTRGPVRVDPLCLHKTFYFVLRGFCARINHPFCWWLPGGLRVQGVRVKGLTRTRLVRRGAVRPVGVRRAAPMACAGSVRAGGKWQSSLHVCGVKGSLQAKHRAPEQYRRGAPAHGVRHHQENHPPTHTSADTLPPCESSLGGCGAKTGAIIALLTAVRVRVHKHCECYRMPYVRAISYFVELGV